MKLNIVPARTGLTWVKAGFKTYLGQPLALSGLFFMFIALLAVASMVPFIGAALALGLLPAATLGLMAATQEAAKGKFPMPTILISAFRANQQQARSMVVLGVLYALGFLAVMGITALVDGGQFAKMYFLGGKLTPELLGKRDFQLAVWVSMALYLPLSLLFWHAPALVHWHGVPPVKSLFFSAMACYKNFGALTVFGLVWMGVFFAAIFVVSLAALVLGTPSFAAVAMMPLALMLFAVFFSSVYFTFVDSFSAPDPGAVPSNGELV
jgi:hypothetical protein